MLMYSPLSAYFDDVILQHSALSNDGKQRQPTLGDFTSTIMCLPPGFFGLRTYSMSLTIANC
jgi:hypothetical protein